jgi:hypothetical protein
MPSVVMPSVVAPYAVHFLRRNCKLDIYGQLGKAFKCIEVYCRDPCRTSEGYFEYFGVGRVTINLPQ